MRGTIAISMLLAVASCKADEWRGFVYKHKGSMVDHERIGTFKTLEACRDAALARLRQMHPDEVNPLVVGDYECGLNCRGSVCEKTEQ